MATQAPSAEPLPLAYNPRYVDIGINLADRVYRGSYRGKQKHPDDLQAVVDRAKQVGCTKLLVTGSDWHSIKDAADLAQEYPGTVYYTAGIHPCSSSIFGVGDSTAHDEEHTPPCDPDPSARIPECAVDLQKSTDNISQLKKILTDAQASGAGHLIAFGEFGLDYDRLHFCNKTVQLHSFAEQLKLAASMQLQLPLFLHSRAAAADFARLMKDAFGPRLERLQRGGVVHSFTGSLEEMRELLDLGLYVGVNGCSFKTEENCAVIKELPLDRIMLETDGPWCEVRPSHAGWKYLIEKLTEPEHAVSETTTTTTTTPELNDVAGAPNGFDKKHKPQKQPNHGKKKNQKTEPDVPSRFKATKTWQEGCMIKGRNEPCTIERIAKIVAGIQGVSVEEVCEAAWRNTNKVFDLGESA
ncbi:TatD family hydrolase [Beauveria bassiana ARSEF 2860]|uniref:TatD family hydrolase n=1 Tax=Beauveria bassiana (strain ARSEF 2860) TaxID=655819 RepID=J5JKU0_BEAB2|nr:TatD family hydrolase [Beauveria bassiana ARSEF 2860]EJP66023.1 TatD family hydrolase [Beauveria bassiana ARSEF 2860]